MAGLLAPHANSALIVRWAWYAYSDGVAPEHALVQAEERGDSTKASWARLVSRIEEGILWHSKQLIRRPPRRDQPAGTHVEKLIERIGEDLRGEDQAEQLTRLLAGYQEYLRLLLNQDEDPLRALCEQALNAAILSYRHYAVDVPEEFPTYVQVNAKSVQDPPGVASHHRSSVMRRSSQVAWSMAAAQGPERT
jgi:hypothetical protein